MSSRNTPVGLLHRNSTDVALAADAVYTGTWTDVTDADSIVVAVSTDANGSYSVQFSPDGTNVDSTLTRYYRTNRINAPKRFTITRRYARVVFTNGSDAQTFMRLQTTIGDKASLNAPIDGTLAQDFDAIVVRPTETSDEIALSKRQGITLWHKWGYNTDVDSGAAETVWHPGGNPTFLTTASTLSVVSDDSNDDDGDTGAHGVVIYGLDANRASAIEVVMLDGLTPVVTTSTWLGINRVALFRAGSSQVNEGTITVTAVTGSSVQATVPAGEGTSQQAVFFTQAGHTALTTDILLSAIKLTGGGGYPEVTFKGWVLSFVSNAKYEVFRKSIDTQVENTLPFEPQNRFPVGEQSVLYFTAETDTNNTEVSVRFSLQEHRGADT